MAKIRVNFKELPLEPLEPGLLRKLIGLADEVGASPVFVYDLLTMEVTGPGFVIVAAGETRPEEKDTEPCRPLENEIVRAMKVMCVCSDWDAGIERIEAQQNFCRFQSAGPKYVGPMFKYCPWCGARLLECEMSEGEKNDAAIS